MVLRWPGIVGDKELMMNAVARWADKPELGFVEAYLAAQADRDNCPVYTKNVRDFADQGIEVPDPLPAGT
jgi:hypothetical protein